MCRSRVHHLICARLSFSLPPPSLCGRCVFFVLGCFFALQVLAALQFFRQTEGIWFLDPQAWVSQHLFKEASIWDIPLVKPRFTCAINPTLLKRGGVDVADTLRYSLDFFTRGGTCTNGQIDVKPP